MYGFGDNYKEGKSHLIAALIKKIDDANNNGEKIINLLGDGTPLRDFMYANDFANVIKICIEKDITESFNVCEGLNYSIQEIAEIAIRAMGFENKINPIFEKNTNMNGQFRKDASNKKLLSLIPNFKFTPLQVGIQKSYEYYKERKKESI